jgi:hypothetical protein
VPFDKVWPYIAFFTSVILVPVTWYFIKKYDEQKQENTKLKKEAAEVTNANLLEKMEVLCEKQDEHQKENRKRFDKVEGHIEMLRDRTHKLSNAVTVLTLSSEKQNVKTNERNQKIDDAQRTSSKS